MPTLPQTPFLCLSTCPDADAAGTLAETLVRERLAACVNIAPGLKSVYRWEGKVERETELLLLIKTTGGRLEALKRRLNELHPYSTPELIAFAIDDGLPAYLKWVLRETAEDDSGQ